MRKFNIHFICSMLILVLSGNSSPQTLYDVTVADFSFSPSTLTITAGDTVRWTNVLGRHSVVADDSSFTSGPVALAPWVYTHVFTTAGNNPYYCAQHGGPGGQGMSGVIIVLPLTTFQLIVNIADGWNMVSVPGVNPDGQNVNNWWSGLTGTVYEFIPGSGYTGITITTPGEGYWMKNAGAQTYNTGDEWPAGGIQIVPHDPINEESGWNIFGGYENTVDVTLLTTTPPGQIVSIYKFVPGTGYQVAAQIVPGYGYWVKVSSACQINIPDVSEKGNQNIAEMFKDDLPDDKADWGRITLTDAAGSSYTLYTVKGQVDLDQYELPPLPPVGIFDARYTTGNLVEDITKESKRIIISSATYPVTIRIDGMDVTVSDAITEKIVNAFVRSGERVVISDPKINILKISGDNSATAPISYELFQNHPNPFNPNTSIRFSIPKEVQVNLSVYNILGEKVKELKNEFMQPGFYDVEFDASTVASGVYFYRIKAGDFVQTKKMILLK